MKKREKDKSSKINWKILIFSFFVVYLTAGIGSIFSSRGVGSSWYEQIKPAITPPNFVFPIVWNILFFLMGLSLYFLQTSKDKNKGKLIGIFVVNLILNILWSMFYFAMKNPFYSFIDLILLWISILLIIILCWKKNKIVSYLNIPYLLWISFAGILNYLSI